LSATEYLALREERHSAKASSPSATLREERHSEKKRCHLTAQLIDAVTTKNKKIFPKCLFWPLGKRSFSECQDMALKEKVGFPQCYVLPLGEGSLPRDSEKALEEEFLFFSFFALFFLGSFHII